MVDIPGVAIIIKNQFGCTNYVVEQYILGEGAELRYVARQNLKELPIAYGFAALLQDYFTTNQ